MSLNELKLPNVRILSPPITDIRLTRIINVYQIEVAAQ